MKTKYEWCMEQKDDGDIIDSHHEDFLEFLPKHEGDLVLIRNECNDIDGNIVDRHWAYVENGKLPIYFSDTSHEINIKVPKRFHQELEKWNNNAI